jgi:hypothetical protein
VLRVLSVCASPGLAVVRVASVFDLTSFLALEGSVVVPCTFCSPAGLAILSCLASLLSPVVISAELRCGSRVLESRPRVVVSVAFVASDPPAIRLSRPI